jgi:hypothetical protein
LMVQFNGKLRLYSRLRYDDYVWVVTVKCPTTWLNAKSGLEMLSVRCLDTSRSYGGWVCLPAKLIQDTLSPQIGDHPMDKFGQFYAAFD